VLLEMSLNSVGQRVALFPRQRACKKLGHPWIGIQSGKRFAIARSPATEPEPVGSKLPWQIHE
jgi:hypothetical protein